MELRHAQRKQAKIKLALQGPSGSNQNINTNKLSGNGIN